MKFLCQLVQKLQPEQTHRHDENITPTAYAGGKHAEYSPSGFAPVDDKKCKFKVNFRHNVWNNVYNYCRFFCGQNGIVILHAKFETLALSNVFLFLLIFQNQSVVQMWSNILKNKPSPNCVRKWESYQANYTENQCLQLISYITSCSFEDFYASQSDVWFLFSRYITKNQY